MAQHSDLIARRMIGQRLWFRNWAALAVGMILSIGLSSNRTLNVPIIIATWISIFIMATLIAWKTTDFTEHVMRGKRFDQMGLGFLSATERTSTLMRVVLHHWRWWLLLLMGMLPGLLIGTVHMQVDVTKILSSVIFNCDNYEQHILDSDYPGYPEKRNVCSEITFDSELTYLKQAGAFGLGMFGVTLLALVLGVRFEWARLIAVGGTLTAAFTVFICTNSAEPFNNLIAATFPYVLCFVFLRPPLRKAKSLLAE